MKLATDKQRRANQTTRGAVEFLPDLASLSRRMRDVACLRRGKEQAAATVAKPRIEAIIFDIGRVIVRLEPKRALATLAGGAGKKQNEGKARDGKRRNSKPAPLSTPFAHGALGKKGAAPVDADALWAAIQRDPLWQDWQEGRVTAREWHAHLCKRFGLKIGFEDFCRAWCNVIAPDLILPERFFARLARRVKLVLLSNTDEIHVAHMESAFGFPRRFDARVYSCEVGASKPGRKIFQAALRAAGTRPENALFVDDVKSYVLAAKKMGMNGVVFRNRGQLEGELRKRKLL
jgi:glucose-1-phosphatase